MGLDPMSVGAVKVRFLPRPLNRLILFVLITVQGYKMMVLQYTSMPYLLRNAKVHLSIELPEKSDSFDVLLLDNGMIADLRESPAKIMPHERFNTITNYESVEILTEKEAAEKLGNSGSSTFGSDESVRTGSQPL